MDWISCYASSQANKTVETEATTVSLTSKKRLEFNVTHSFIEIAWNSLILWQEQGEAIMKTSRGSNAPFLIRNRTGHTISFRTESDGTNASSPTTSQRLEDGKDAPWRMDDWTAMRESATTTVVHNALALTLEGTPWERLRHMSVEREGEQVYRLKPKLDKVTHRMLCEVKLVNNVKVVTFRSTFKIENLTLVPSEVVVVDDNGRERSPIFKLRTSLVIFPKPRCDSVLTEILGFYGSQLRVASALCRSRTLTTS